MTAATTSPAASPSPAGRISQDDLERLVRDGSVTEIMLGVPDIQGRLQGKAFNAAVFLERMTDGAEMCAYILATDIDMTPLAGFSITGWHQGFGDFLVKPDFNTARMLPNRPGAVLLIGTPVHHDDTPLRMAPRFMLQTQIDRLARLGYLVKTGVESEFILYTEKGSERTPAWDKNLDYALEHPPVVDEFFSHLRDAMNKAGLRYEAIKTEGTAGQAEVTFAYRDDPLTACDDYTVFRYITRDTAQRLGLLPAFMAAPESGIASGLHLHLSLWSKDGVPGFARDRGQDLPPLVDQAVAGLLSALPHMAPLYAPTVNSYKRYQPYSFAPVRYNWGVDNRGCAIRVTGHGKGAHLEVRLAGADANPYLALTAYLAAMAQGIEEKLTARPACDGDAYEDPSGTIPVYADLAEALQYFEHSTCAHNLLGKDVVDHYARAAHAELDWHRRHVTDVEQHRGLR